MQKSTVFLFIMALASAGVSAGLWMQLRAERALNAELSERLNAALAIAKSPRRVPDNCRQPAAEPPAVIAAGRSTADPRFHSAPAELAAKDAARAGRKTGKHVSAG